MHQQRSELWHTERMCLAGRHDCQSFSSFERLWQHATELLRMLLCVNQSTCIRSLWTKRLSCIICCLSLPAICSAIYRILEGEPHKSLSKRCASDLCRERLTTLTKGIATELAKKNVRCNVIAPGPVWTPLPLSSFPEKIVSLCPHQTDHILHALIPAQCQGCATPEALEHQPAQVLYLALRK